MVTAADGNAVLFLCHFHFGFPYPKVYGVGEMGTPFSTNRRPFSTARTFWHLSLSIIFPHGEIGASTVYAALWSFQPLAAAAIRRSQPWTGRGTCSALAVPLRREKQ